MKTPRKILLAVKNPDGRRHAAIDKAIRIAKDLGAKLELFHSISMPVFFDLEPLTGTSVNELRHEALSLRARRLERFAAHARAQGVAATSHVAWDYPPHEAILRRASAIGADLIVAETHAGRRSMPWLIHLTDWELLRLSKVPVLLLKNARPWRRPVFLAAVDPGHAHAKPSGLDLRILANAGALARRLRGSMHVVHSNYPPLSGMTVGDPILDATTLAMAYESQKIHGRRLFGKFADARRIPRARRHLVDGDPVFGIPRTARAVKASLVVMGAVSRSGLKRVFIGNTAERVLDALPCDVLVVKP